MKAAYYNEFDPFAAAWLRELIKENLIAPGDVDERSIKEVKADDLRGYAQCHFFAGIGGWSYALRLAGWPDDRPVWTGSCPCQPFSAAGQRKGTADDRHLWPELRRLIADGAPAVVFGEQVASKDGRLWLAGVRADLEALGFAVGAADLCAAGVGAPHIRQRLWWVANADGGFASHGNLQRRGQHGLVSQDGGAGGMADADQGQRGRLADWQGRIVNGATAGRVESDGIAQSSGHNCFILCTDGKHRRVAADAEGHPEPALFPLAHGVQNRVGTLRGAGNAIVPQVAAEFIQAAEEAARDAAVMT